MKAKQIFQNWYEISGSYRVNIEQGFASIYVFKGYAYVFQQKTRRKSRESIASIIRRYENS